jgi:hypothetical protein
MTVCPFGGNKLRTHNFLVHDIVTLTKAAGGHAETHFLNFSTDSNLTPDALLRNLDLGEEVNRGEDGIVQDIWVDITVPHPSSISYLHGSAKSATVMLGAAEDAATRKKNKYAHCLQFDHPRDIFIPLVIESYGAMHTPFADFIVLASGLVADRMGINKSAVANYWLKRFSVSLQKGIARMLLKRSEECTTAGTHISPTDGALSEATYDQDFISYETRADARIYRWNKHHHS